MGDESSFSGEQFLLTVLERFLVHPVPESYFGGLWDMHMCR
jgi:hypothetical protein